MSKRSVRDWRALVAGMELMGPPTGRRVLVVCLATPNGPAEGARVACLATSTMEHFGHVSVLTRWGGVRQYYADEVLRLEGSP